jgi:hypothetical protein
MAQPLGAAPCAAVSRVLPLLLLLLPAAAVGGGGGTESDTWTITDETTCRGGELRVDQDIHIVQGGALVLEGCRLLMDSAAYTDRWLSADREGLHVQVDEGARLVLAAMDGRGAGIARADGRYGYRVTIEGGLHSEGTAATPNVISGLEGYIAETFVGAGLRVFGHVTINHTDFIDNVGPSIFAQPGSRIDMAHANITKASGAIALRGAQFTADDLFINIGIQAFTITRSDVHLARTVVEANRRALVASESSVVIEKSRLMGYEGAIEFTASDVDVRDSALEYGRVGVASKYDAESAARHTTALHLERTSLAVVDGLNATTGVHLVGANTVMLSGCTFAAHDGTVVQITNTDDIEIRDCTFETTTGTDIQLMNPLRFSMSGNRLGGGVQVWRHLEVSLKEHDGAPIADAALAINGVEAVTDEAGKAFIVRPVVTDEQGMPTSTEDPIHVTTADGRLGRFIVPIDADSIQISFVDPTPMAWWWVLAGSGVVAGGLFVVLHRQMGRRDAGDQ